MSVFEVHMLFRPLGMYTSVAWYHGFLVARKTPPSTINGRGSLQRRVARMYSTVHYLATSLSRQCLV